MITLIIVDCQNDFISGTMIVNDAKKKLDNIKEFITNNVKKIDKIVFSVKWRPFTHSSFKRNGGTMPNHCVQYTPGACIEPKLLKLVQSLNINYEVNQTNSDSLREQLGAFEDVDLVQDGLGSWYYLDSIVRVNADTDFVICGITDSVKYSIENLLNGKYKILPKLFKDGSIECDSFVKEKEVDVI